MKTIANLLAHRNLNEFVLYVIEVKNGGRKKEKCRKEYRIFSSNDFTENFFRKNNFKAPKNKKKQCSRRYGLYKDFNIQLE